MHPRPRRAVRVLVRDHAGRVLLLHHRYPHDAPHWAPPGGGVDPGEDDRAAAARELREELGRDDIAVGPEVMRWRHVFGYGSSAEPVDQSERVFGAWTGDAAVASGLASQESDGIDDARWWSPEELAVSDEEVWPHGLAALLPLLDGSRVVDLGSLAWLPGLRLRPGAPADADAVTALHVRTAVAAWRPLHDTPFPEDEVRRRWAAWPGRLVLAELRGELVGFAAVTGDELRSLHVAPEHQGRGLGGTLLAVVPEARWLRALEQDAAARRFYRRHGWREDPGGLLGPGGLPELRLVR